MAKTVLLILQLFPDPIFQSHTFALYIMLVLAYYSGKTSLIQIKRYKVNSVSYTPTCINS